MSSPFLSSFVIFTQFYLQLFYINVLVVCSFIMSTIWSIISTLLFLVYFVEFVRRFRTWCSPKRVVGTHVMFCWLISTVNTGKISAMCCAEWFVDCTYVGTAVGPVITTIHLLDSECRRLSTTASPGKYPLSSEIVFTLTSISCLGATESLFCIISVDVRQWKTCELPCSTPGLSVVSPPQFNNGSLMRS